VLVAQRDLGQQRAANIEILGQPPGSHAVFKRAPFVAAQIPRHGQLLKAARIVRRQPIGAIEVGKRLHHSSGFALRGAAQNQSFNAIGLVSEQGGQEFNRLPTPGLIQELPRELENLAFVR